MRKAAALSFIVMIQLATSMTPIMASCSGYTCILPPNIPGGPGNGGTTPGGPGNGGTTPGGPGNGGTTPGGPGNGPAGRCPLNALKLGACVDLLNGLVHVGLGDPVVNQCCPVLGGVLALEAALCLCTTIRAKVLNLNIFLPIALELIASCGLTVPPGFKCPAN